MERCAAREAESTGRPLHLLRELLARGGMGEVFRAIAVGADGFEKPVVVKRILPTVASAEATAMFAAEAKRMSRLVHPNIVQVIDFGRGEEGDYFLVMELVEGLDLGAFARAHRDGRLPIGMALFVVSQMLRGLGHAHTQADDEGRTLVHRDVSPGNVLVSRLGEVKVADFGVAIVTGPDELLEGESVVGKPSYMAPEQWRGEALDARADLFATGVVLFQLLTGEMPFAGPNAAARQEQAAGGVMGRSLDLRPEIGEALDALIVRSLAADPAARFASARAMRRALEAASPEPLANSDDLADAVQGAIDRAPTGGRRVVALGIARNPDSQLGELTRVDATGTFSLVVTDDIRDQAPTLKDEPLRETSGLFERDRPRRWRWLIALPIAMAGWWALRDQPRATEEVPSAAPIATTAPSVAPPRSTQSAAPAPSDAEPRPRPAPISIVAKPTAAPSATSCVGEVILAAKGSWDVTGGPRAAQAPHRDTWPCGSYTLTGTSRQDGRVVTRTVVVREGAQSATRFE